MVIFLAITSFIRTQVYVTINASNENLAIIFILNIAPITSSMLLSIFNFMSDITSSHLRLWTDFLSWWKLSNHTICYNPLEILLCLDYFIFFTSLWHWLNNLLIDNEWVHNSYVNIVPKRPAVELSWNLSIIAIDSCFLIKRLFLVTIFFWIAWINCGEHHYRLCVDPFHQWHPIAISCINISSFHLLFRQHILRQSFTIIGSYSFTRLDLMVFHKLVP